MISVYFAYSAGGTLLYVGQTANVRSRFEQHRVKSSWFDKYAFRRVRVRSTREEAVALERKAIALLKPLYNISGQSPGVIPQSVFDQIAEVVASKQVKYRDFEKEGQS